MHRNGIFIVSLVLLATLGCEPSTQELCDQTCDRALECGTNPFFVNYAQCTENCEGRPYSAFSPSCDQAHREAFQCYIDLGCEGMSSGLGPCDTLYDRASDCSP